MVRILVPEISWGRRREGGKQDRAGVKCSQGDFPGSPVVKISPSKAGERVQSLFGELRSHMLLAKKQYCNKVNKDFKNGPHQKRAGRNVVSA